MEGFRKLSALIITAATGALTLAVLFYGAAQVFVK